MTVFSLGEENSCRWKCPVDAFLPHTVSEFWKWYDSVLIVTKNLLLLKEKLCLSVWNRICKQKHSLLYETLADCSCLQEWCELLMNSKHSHLDITLTMQHYLFCVVCLMMSLCSVVSVDFCDALDLNWPDFILHTRQVSLLLLCEFLMGFIL